MKKSRKAISLILIVILAMSLLASCAKTGNEGSTPPTTSSNPPSSPSPSASAPVKGDVIKPVEGVKYAKEMDVIVDNNKIPALSPFLPSSGFSSSCWVFTMIYDRLVAKLDDGTYGPELATSWDTTDYQTYTFKLRNDVTFHNGDKFTAQDVVDTMAIALAAPGSGAYDRWSGVETATVIDEYTLEIKLKNVDVNFLFSISVPFMGIVNKKAIDADSEKGTWIGTGAWRATDFLTNDYVTMVRNDDYWGQKTITEKISLRFVPEPSTRLMRLQNGESDVCFSLDPVDQPLIEADTENFVAYKFIYNICNMMAFNMADPITGDLNFRKAVASAIDRVEIGLACLGEYAQAETQGTFYGLETEFRNNDIPIIPYDIDKAKEYLADSPYNGETIEITAAISTNIIVAEILQQQLSKIGINIKVNGVDPANLMSATAYGNNTTQIVIFVGAFTSSAASFRNQYYPGTGTNRTSYNNPELTELLDKAPTVIDENERRDLYYKMQEMVAEDPPSFNLFWMENMASCVKGVGGIITSTDAYMDLTYIYRVID